jgi:hypothetical protein
MIDNSLIIEKKQSTSNPERGSSSIEIRPSLNLLYQSYVCVRPMDSLSKACFNISKVSVKVFPSLTQNLTHARCSWKYVIFLKKKISDGTKHTPRQGRLVQNFSATLKVTEFIKQTGIACSDNYICRYVILDDVHYCRQPTLYV